MKALNSGDSFGGLRNIVLILVSSILFGVISSR